MILRSIVRFVVNPLFLGISGSALVHAASAGVIYYLLLLVPHVFFVDVQQGESVVIQAQMSAVASTSPEQVTEVDVTVEPVPSEPPPPLAFEHTPVEETLIPTPASIPIVRSGEYEPTEVPPQQEPPQSLTNVAVEAEVHPQELAKAEAQPEAEKPAKQQAIKSPDRQIAEVVRDSASKINVAAVAPAVVGAVDEMPRKLANNRIPYYPLDALRSGLEGRVVLRVQINTAGRAENIELETSSGFASFDQSAIDAVRDWRFAPAKRQGLAVMHEVLIPVRFRISRG